jgi:hypothetical protein
MCGRKENRMSSCAFSGRSLRSSTPIRRFGNSSAGLR